jgi:hypothetical protein
MAGIVRKQAKPQVNFRLRRNTVARMARGAKAAATTKSRVATKAHFCLNSAFSLFVNTPATNSAYVSPQPGREKPAQRVSRSF